MILTRLSHRLQHALLCLVLLVIGVGLGWMGHWGWSQPRYTATLSERQQQIDHLHQEADEAKAELSAAQEQISGYQQYLVSKGPAEVDQAQLEGYVLPIAGLQPTYGNRLSLPNAPRLYRGGVHQGIDFAARRGQTARAVGDGIIIRIDRQYQEPSLTQLEEFTTLSRQVQFTPEYIFDHLRGRQVWLLLPGNIVVRYCHLETTADLQLGQPVQLGQSVGTVGASGTVDGVAHLHLEIRVGEGYLGQGLAYPDPMVSTFQRFFSGSD